MALDYLLLEGCLEEILSVIKPSEPDRVKRLETIDRLANSISSISSLQGAVVKPFGSFVSNLYSMYGDLDISLQLSKDLQTCVNKKRKLNALRDTRRALQTQGIAAYTQFIPAARVPVLKYVDNRSGISCDVSVDNHSGRMKSKILSQISSLDQRFGDMVLLVKEWAKAQHINDPKTGTLNSYSLCLLVIFHFQTCEPPILPPLCEICEENAATDMMSHTETYTEGVCAANISALRSKNSQPTNESSLHKLLVSFFQKFSRIKELSSEYVMCTYSGRWETIQDSQTWMHRSDSMLVEDPFDRKDNSARAVGLKGLDQISSVINDARMKLSSAPILHNRNTLLHLLCRPSVSFQLGATVVATPYATQRNHQQVRNAGYGRAWPVHNHQEGQTTGYARARPVHNHQRSQTTGNAAARPFHNNHQQIQTIHHAFASSYRHQGNHPTGYAGVNQATAHADNVRGYAVPGYTVSQPAHEQFVTGYAVSAYAEPRPANEQFATGYEVPAYAETQPARGKVYPARRFDAGRQSTSSGATWQRRGLATAQDTATQARNPPRHNYVL